MTYLQILELLKEIALAQPNVHTVVREFLDLNREDTEYSAVVIQDRDGERTEVLNQDYQEFTWHIGYVDRLTDDEKNRDHIFSTGVRVLNTIVDVMRDRFSPRLEIGMRDRINTFNQRFTASCAGVYAVVYVNIPLSDCVDYQDTGYINTLEKTIKTSGRHRFVPGPGEGVWDDVIINVDVPGCKEEIERTVTINRNGQLVVTPPEGNVFSAVTVNTSVHPSVSLSETYTSNGVYNINGEFNGGTVAVSVPSDQKPEVVLSAEEYGSAGENIYSYTPDPGTVYSGVDLTVNFPTTYLNTSINSNGLFPYSPQSYGVEGFDSVDINVDVHPSTSLSETYTSNGVYNIADEFNGGQVTVSVPVKTEIDLDETWTEPGTYDIYPPEGYVYNHISVDVMIDVPTVISDTWEFYENGDYSFSSSENEVWGEVFVSVDVHPSTSLSETYTSNGVYNINGEFNGGTVAVSVPVKEEVYLSDIITSNGVTDFYPPAGYTINRMTINTQVHPSTSLSETYTSNGVYTISGDFRGGTVAVSVPQQGIFPSGTLSISNNGSYDVTSYASVDVSVAGVQPSGTMSVTSNGVYDVSSYASVSVSVPTTTTVTLTQSAYNNLSVKDPNTIYLIYS